MSIHNAFSPVAIVGCPQAEPRAAAGTHLFVVTDPGRDAQRTAETYGLSPRISPIGTFDEHQMLGFLPNAVWSMRQDEDAWAQHAFRLMQQKLQGENSDVKITVPMTLIHRPLSVEKRKG